MHTEALGEFEQLVLLAIVRVSPEAYGVTIRQEIEEKTGRTVTIGALYTALDRLDRKGFVSSSLSEPTPQRGGRAKRYYKLRPAGAAALKRSRRALESMWAGITPDLSKGRS